MQAYQVSNDELFDGFSNRFDVNVDDCCVASFDSIVDDTDCCVLLLLLLDFVTAIIAGNVASLLKKNSMLIQEAKYNYYFIPQNKQRIHYSRHSPTPAMNCNSKYRQRIVE